MKRSPLASIASLLLALSVATVAVTPAFADAPAAAPVAQPAEVVDATVKKVQAFYDRTTTFKSDFVQEFWVKAYNEKKSSSGTVVFAKPGKMSWTYKEPQGNRVVSNGAQLKVYEAANKQMYEQTVDKSQYPAALSFLTGQGNLADAFNFELFLGSQMNFPGGLVLVGVPKTPTPAYQKVLFYVDEQSYQVRRVMVLDGQGNRNRFDFNSPRVNEPVPPAEFQFSPPAGTSIVHPQ